MGFYHISRDNISRDSRSISAALSRGFSARPAILNAEKVLGTRLFNSTVHIWYYSYAVLKCYCDQNNHFNLSSDFETLFTKHSPCKILGLNCEKTVSWNYNFPIQWSAIITPERIQWRHLLRMQCVNAAYSLCKTRVWESESSKLSWCILNKP